MNMQKKLYNVMSDAADKYNSYSWGYDIRKQHNLERDSLMVFVTWRIGGECGGNCWGDEPMPISEYYLDKEPELEALDVILQEIAPNITYLDYKAVMEKVLLKGEYVDREYYGNYTEYAYKAITYLDLLDALKERGYIK